MVTKSYEQRVELSYGLAVKWKAISLLVTICVVGATFWILFSLARQGDITAIVVLVVTGTLLLFGSGVTVSLIVWNARRSSDYAEAMRRRELRHDQAAMDQEAHLARQLHQVSRANSALALGQQRLSRLEHPDFVEGSFHDLEEGGEDW